MAPLLPFSGKEYHKNATGDNPCIICGREVKNPHPDSGLLIVIGGGAFADPGQVYDPNDAGYMGIYDLGPECAKREPLKTLIEALRANPARPKPEEA